MGGLTKYRGGYCQRLWRSS